MKLYINSASPYARLARVVSIEVGLGDVIQYVEVDPWNETRELIEINPAAKIPVLVCADGRVLIESEIICDYLIRYAGEPGMLPEEQVDSVGHLQILGLARAAMDCAFGVVIQTRFGASESVLSRRWRDALPLIAREVERICDPFPNLPDRPDLVDITLAVAFQYVSFRLPEVDWTSQAPSLSKWINGIGELESFTATRPR